MICCLPVERGEGKRLRGIDNEFIRMYIIKDRRQSHIESMSEETSLMATSFPSQHNPGHHASGPSSAKAVAEWEDLEEESSKGTSSSWED